MKLSKSARCCIGAAVCAAIVLCCAAPVYAVPEMAAVTFCMVDIPLSLEGRTVIATIGTGPSDANSKTVLLNELNHYRQTIEVTPGTYYCNAAVQYDPTGNYPLIEENSVIQIVAAPGGEYTLTYKTGEENWFELVTGHKRYYSAEPKEETPEGYDTTEQAQIGAYLTAPEGFDRHVMVFLQNLYTGSIYGIDLYRANLLASVITNADAGKYTYLNGFVTGDEDDRFSFTCEDGALMTENGVNFHITVVDTKYPERKLTTPSRDGNETVQEAAAYNSETNESAESESQSTALAVAEPQLSPASNGLLAFLDLVPFVVIGLFFLWRWKKRR